MDRRDFEGKTMRIMAVLGSPRRQGNTAKVLGWTEEQFRAGGHEVSSAKILDYRVQGCGDPARQQDVPETADQIY